jgi:hypothetical protein
MAKWLEQLRKNSETAPRGTLKTLKTLKTHIGEVSKVLRVSSKAVSEKFPPDEETGLGGFEGFEGTPPERLRNYSGKKSENARRLTLKTDKTPTVIIASSTARPWRFRGRASTSWCIGGASMTGNGPLTSVGPHEGPTSLHCLPSARAGRRSK